MVIAFFNTIKNIVYAHNIKLLNQYSLIKEIRYTMNNHQTNSLLNIKNTELYQLYQSQFDQTFTIDMLIHDNISI